MVKGLMIACGGFLTMAHSVGAAEIIDISILTAAGESIANVAPGQTVNFKVVANYKTPTGQLIGGTSTPFNGLGFNDGVSGFKLALTQDAADAAKVDITSVSRDAFFQGAGSTNGVARARGTDTATDTGLSDWAVIIGSLTDGTGTRAGTNGGDFTLLTGSFTVAPTATGTGVLKFDFPGLSYGATQTSQLGMRVNSNGSGTGGNAFTTSTTSNDAFADAVTDEHYLTIVVPEPASVALVGLGGLLVLARRRV